MKRILGWALAIIPAVIFVQSLFFKFAGSDETRIIFETIGTWMADLPLIGALAPAFAAYGGVTVGLVELVAAGLLLIPATRRIGALIGLVVISGAIFFHLGTPLGVDRVVNAAGDTDGGALFAMACVVWLCCAATLVLNSRTHDEAPQTAAA
ncbi:MAG: hypothetical protein AAF648_01430 [Pseudomonadota bacterium]